MTQKDIHNILVKSDMKYKQEIIMQCDYDINKIKEFESAIAKVCNVCNEYIKTVSEVLAYMCTEI